MLSIRTEIREPGMQTEENHSSAIEDKQAGSSGRNSGAMAAAGSNMEFVEFVDLTQVGPF